MHILPSTCFSLHFFSDLLLGYKNSTLLGILWPNNSAILRVTIFLVTHAKHLAAKITKFGGHTSNGLSERGVSRGGGGKVGGVVGGSKASPGMTRVKALFVYVKLCLTTQYWRNILFVSGTDEVVRWHSNTVALCTSWMFWSGAGQSVRK